MVDRRHLDTVETAYTFDMPEPEWLVELGRPMRDSLAGVRTFFAFEVIRRDGQFSLGQHGAEDPAVLAQIARSFAELPPEILSLFFREPLQARCSTELLADVGIDLDTTVLADAYEKVGFRDVFSMLALDPLGSGVVFGVGLRERVSTPRDQRLLWTQVAAHVAAGFRLRRRLAGVRPIEHAGAVLGTNGKLEHVEAGIDADLRERLSEAVRRVEIARARGCELEEALALWQALIAGEWSLVDHFEGGGRRFYAAVRNPPAVARSRALTRREAEVVSYVACGTPTRAAAYALGLDEVTVRGYLHTAMAKLGVASRAELVNLRAMLIEHGRIDPEPGVADGRVDPEPG